MIPALVVRVHEIVESFERRVYEAGGLWSLANEPTSSIYLALSR